LRTKHLSIVSALDLTHHPAGPALLACTIDPAAEVFPFSYAAEEIPDLARLAERQLHDPNGAVDAWARRFGIGDSDGLALMIWTFLVATFLIPFILSKRYSNIPWPPTDGRFWQR